MIAQCESLISNIFGKTISYDVKHVYNYQDPTKDPDFRAGEDYLLAPSLDEFEQGYEVERNYQLSVIADPHKHVFASELEQIYKILVDHAPKSL